MHRWSEVQHGVDVARGWQLAISSWLKFVATCAVAVRISAARAVTSTVSVSAAGPIVTSRGSTWVGATVTVRVWVPKPLSSNVTV
jgi:hypothetical protein